LTGYTKRSIIGIYNRIYERRANMKWFQIARKIGNSHVATLPKEWCKKHKVTQNTPLTVTERGKKLIVEVKK
jgi:hypothetical protein